jgi:hypothetical protein
MKGITALSSVLLVSLLQLCSAWGASWEYIYDGTKLPDDPALGDKVWRVFNRGIKTSEVCEITPEGELHINDPPGKVCFFYREQKDLSHTTLEARVKVLSQSGPPYTVCLEIEDGADTTYLCLFPDHITLVGGPTHMVDMTEYHILRMVRDGKSMIVYVDDEKVIEGLVGGDSSSRRAITFGAGSTPGEGEHYWDYVVYTTKGAFSPEELPNYQSSLPVESEGKLATCWGRIKSSI